MDIIKTWLSEFKIYSIKGTVAETNKNLETKISGSGGGGYVHNGSGFNAPVNIKSTTTIHDQIFLIDENNKEHSFQLADFNVACRAGNALSIISIHKQGQSNGEYVAIYNHSTNNCFFSDKAINKISKLKWFIPLIVMILFFFLAKQNGWYIFWIPWAAWFVINKSTTSKIKNGLNEYIRNSYGI